MRLFRRCFVPNYDVVEERVRHDMQFNQLNADQSLKYIVKTDLIIWDEAPITHKHAFKVLDKSLRDIMSRKDTTAKDLTFGGKTVLLGSDFRQILPVIPRCNRADTVLTSISHSHLWHSCHKFSFKTKMRLNQEENEFSDWLLQVGKTCKTRIRRSVRGPP